MLGTVLICVILCDKVAAKMNIVRMCLVSPRTKKMYLGTCRLRGDSLTRCHLDISQGREIGGGSIESWQVI